ncbi:C6 transcription factor [Teratosphaeria destructans]|uniref:C6 transcription factor n=1 Tax=Teratosphaeria destructans TaxID=418781 RepID=A0A9W7SR68_9PEZI|nr:C6 transcription factor [Teratosphaeria destructans]
MPPNQNAGLIVGGTPTTIEAVPSRLQQLDDGTAGTPNSATLNTVSTIRSCRFSGLSEREMDYLINLFYANFWLVHPMLVPRHAYAQQSYPDHVKLVICLIGSYYASPTYPRASLWQATSSAFSTLTVRDIHRVQALVLYAILLHAQQQSKEATACIVEATDIAISIGLNRPEFASERAGMNPVVEESYRRSWWELYIVDGFMAVVHQLQGFRSNSVGMHPNLPCEETLYAQAICDHSPVTLQQFEDRAFATEACAYSSFCYRIEAIRIISRILAVARANDAEPDEIQAVDNALASWKYHLPVSKSDVIDQYGHVDHMLLQANVFIQCATIILHFPRSDLPLTMSTCSDLACTRHTSRITATSRQHTVKAISASKELSNLAALPWCMTVHSPFFTYGLILGCIVQLSASSSHAQTCLQQHRDRVTLMIGALKTLSEKWAVAQNALRHLVKVSGSIFCAKPTPDPLLCTSAHDSMFDEGGSPADMSWFDLFALDELPNELPAIGSII